MSSIFGKINSGSAPVDLEEIGHMKDALNYWQPDSEDIWSSGNVGLGCLLLRNTPESLTENLPANDTNLELCITTDARLFNRGELLNLLSITTTAESTVTDSFIILQLYKKYKSKCVSFLNGDFAFAIWDYKEQILFCARDQMGVKPFFYYVNTNFFAFASEKKGILCLQDIDKTIDQDFLCNQLYRYVLQAADTTIFKNIKRLPPATSLIYSAASNRFELEKYWTLDPYTELKLKSRDEYHEGLRYHFENAVKTRIRSVYPVGSELSGGIDSSLVTGVASHFLRQSGKNVLSFTNSLDEGYIREPSETWEDERIYAESVIQYNEIEDYTFVTENIWANPIDEIEYILNINDGLEMRSQKWLLPIKKAAQQKNVRTLLSGFPGDEMVSYRGGHSYLDDLDDRNYFKYFTAETNLVSKIKPFLSPRIELIIHKLKNIVRFRGKRIEELVEFYGLPGKLRFNHGDVAWRDVEYRERFISHRHYQKYSLLKPQVPLRMESETRFGLGFNVEPSYPMADIQLTQFYLSVPNELKSEGPLRRTLLRNALRAYLPKDILTRDKKYGKIAPFKSTASFLRNQQIATLNYLNDRRKLSLFDNPRIFLPHNNIAFQPIKLENIMWLEKYFENS